LLNITIVIALFVIIYFIDIDILYKGILRQAHFKKKVLHFMYMYVDSFSDLDTLQKGCKISCGYSENTQVLADFTLQNVAASLTISLRDFAIRHTMRLTVLPTASTDPLP
jgi:hypothetical protein